MSKEDAFATKPHAATYKKYRNKLPEMIIRKVTNFLDETFPHSECDAVDVGCGSGQSTIPLAKHLKSIIGVDTSLAQLEEIDFKLENATFMHGNASNLPIPDESVHLVIAVNAVHWFNLAEFYKEVDRVLIPGGVLALVQGGGFSVQMPGVEEDTFETYLRELKKETAEFWDSSAHFNEHPLDFDSDLPYKMKVKDESGILQEKVTVSSLMGRLSSMSGIAAMLREDPKKAKQVLGKFEKDLLKKIGKPDGLAEESVVTLNKLCRLLMSRKPFDYDKHMSFNVENSSL